MKRLKKLALMSNNITDISVVSKLVSLEHLDLSYNNVKDISPISMLIELTGLAIHGSDELTSTDELLGLRKLKTVLFENFAYVDLNIFRSMPELIRLALFDIGAADYSILPQLSKLKILELNCDNKIFQHIKKIKTLIDLGLFADVSYSESGERIGDLTDLSGIGELTNLTSLEIYADNCHDISPLASLGIERMVIFLPEDCDLTPLKSLPNLKRVFVAGYGDVWDLTENDSYIEKIRALLPNVEVNSY